MNTKENNQKIALFNRTVPVGSKVIVTLDDESERETTTTSEAWVLGGHTPVVLLDGIAGAYMLSRVVKA